MADNPENAAEDDSTTRIQEKFSSYKEKSFLEPLLTEYIEDDDFEEGSKMIRKGKSDQEMQEEQIQRISEISKAIDNGFNKIVEFKFDHLQSNLSCGDKVKAKVTLLLYNKNENKMEEKILLSKEISTKSDPNSKDSFQVGLDSEKYSSGYLLAQVGVSIPIGRRRCSTGFEEIRHYYGIKPIGSDKNGDFELNCEGSGVHLLTPDHPSMSKFNFKINDLKKWSHNPSLIDEVWSKTKQLSKISDTPFIVYEITNFHSGEDWDAIRQRKEDISKFTQLRLGTTTVVFSAVNSDGNITKELATSPFGFCPLSLKYYTNIDNQVEYLNRRLDELMFTKKETYCGKTTIEVSLVDSDTFSKAPPGNFKKQTWEDGKVDQSFFLVDIQQIPVPYRTGPNGEGTWVTHSPRHNSKQHEAARSIQNMPSLTPHDRKLAMIINNFMLADREPDPGPDGLRRSFLKLFAERKDEIINCDTGLNATVLAAELQKTGIITSKDFAKIFDDYMDDIGAREKMKKRQGLPKTFINLD